MNSSIRRRGFIFKFREKIKQVNQVTFQEYFFFKNRTYSEIKNFARILNYEFSHGNCICETVCVQVREKLNGSKLNLIKYIFLKKGGN